MKDATLCYVMDGSKLLLQKKARGFGKGKWNAPGGKIRFLESPERAAVREVREETGLEVRGLRHQGILNFAEQGGHVFSVHVFVADSFSGEMKASVEGKLKWFPVGAVPYDDMWEDDRVWLPRLLRGEKFRGLFLFSKGFTSLLKYEMEEITEKEAA